MFESTGIKRFAVAVLNIIIPILQTIPGSEQLVILLQTLVGMLGGVALVHASISGDTREKLLSTLSAVISLLIVASDFFPSLAPLKPILEKIALAIGSGALAARFNVK